MEKKFRTAVTLMLIPVAINVGVTVYCFLALGPEIFKGYLLGTALSFVFSIAWIIMVRRITLSNLMVLFTLSLGSLPIKIIIFALVALGGHYLLGMNQLYFGIAFLFGIATSLIIEVWFIIAINKLNVKLKLEENNNNNG